MANGIKYQAHEILNKVLNSAETGLQVDIVAGAEYAEDAAHTSADTGNFILGVRNDTLAALGGTDGDYVPFQMNSSGALFVDIADGGQLDTIIDTLETTLTAIETDAAAIEVLLTAANVDHAANEVLLTGIDADTDAIKTDMAAIEVLLTAANVDHAANEALLTTIDADTGAIKTAVEIIDNAISGSEMQVDVVASLPAGSAAIGKLAANSGVDIGDVDVTSIVPGTGATNLGKAEDAAHSSGDTGVMALAVRNDVLESLGGSDGDYAALQVTKTGSLNVTETVGHLGAIFEDGTDNITSKKVVAIQFIEDTTFTTLTPVDSSYIGTASGNGDAIDTSNTFPQGMTIFGRWTGFRLASGTIVAYQGDW